MNDDCAYHMKEENKSLNPFVEKNVNSANTEKKKKNSANTSRISRVFLYWPFFHIGRVCSRYDAG